MNNFTTNLYIIYTDECTNFTMKTGTSYSMTSIVAPYDYYKNTLEKDWNNLKAKYNISEGTCLHFTDIKALLNPTYFSKAIDKRNIAMETIFSTNNIVDQSRLFNFYTDVVNFIDTHDFAVITNNLLHDKSKSLNTYVENNNANSIWYILFRDHLNSLTNYAVREKYTFKNVGKPNFKASLKFKAKIRYDGDYGLSNKNDIRDAFSHSITAGTTMFNSKTIRDCFDELRFINKAEVGYCSSCTSIPLCSNKNFSHAGNEIVDFIATYSGRYLSESDYITHFTASNPRLEALHSYTKSTTIYVDSKVIKPLDILIKKIYLK